VYGNGKTDLSYVLRVLFIDLSVFRVSLTVVDSAVFESMRWLPYSTRLDRACCLCKQALVT
jgi:hypothetical protein